MAMTAEQIKTIRQELNSLKPASATLEGKAEMSVKQIIFALAQTLERMKKRGFEIPEIVQKLHEKGIEIKPQTLAKYLAEARRHKDAKKQQKTGGHPTLLRAEDGLSQCGIPSRRPPPCS